jgi:6-phosphogluconolactonase
MAKAPGPFEVLDTPQAVASETARVILAAAIRAISLRGRFQLVLAGGRTPLAAYNLLVGEPADWDRWHIFLGDERCLPADDTERNSVAAAHAFLDRVPIPRDNLHWIAAERGAAEAALDYEATVRERAPFDLVLLGMGEDGHTASLFPGLEIPSDRLVAPVYNAPKPPSERVSLTPRALADCRELLILVTGAEKGAALAAWRAGADLPVSEVASGRAARVLVDRAADGGSRCPQS